MNVDSSNSGEKINDFGFYQTESGAYILDQDSISVSETTKTPLLLTKVIRDKIYIYDFKYTPQGAVSKTDGNLDVYYEYRGRWYKDKFDSDGIFDGTVIYYDESILLNDETNFNLDLNNDSDVGDRIKSVKYDGSIKNDDFSIYETNAGAYVFDQNDLDIDVKTVEPKILTKQVSNRVQLYKNKYDFDAVLEHEDGSGIYYQDSRGRWYKDNFDENGTYENTERYNLNLVLNEEHKLDKDLNDDGQIGFEIDSVEIKTEGESKSLYKSKSGVYIFDDSGLNEGDNSIDPVILKNTSGSREWKPSSNHDLQAIYSDKDSNNNDEFSIYFKYSHHNYKITRDESGKIFNLNPYYQSILEEEEDKGIDINNDGVIGKKTIIFVLFLAL